MRPGYDREYRILVVGDSGVGKTCLLHKLSTMSFLKELLPTVGVDFAHFETRVKSEQIRLQLWDTAGRPSFRSITNSYFRGADGFLLLCSLADRASFEHLETWIHDIQVFCGETIPIAILATKQDLNNQRQVTQEDLTTLWKIPQVCRIQLVSLKEDPVEILFQDFAAYLHRKTHESRAATQTVPAMLEKIEAPSPPPSRGRTWFQALKSLLQ